MERIRAFPFASDSAYDSVVYDLIQTRVGSKSRRINQSQCTFPHFVIGLGLLLLLTTPTAQFSLDRKRQSRTRNQSAVSTRSLSHTLLIITPPIVKTSLHDCQSLAS